MMKLIGSLGTELKNGDKVVTSKGEEFTLTGSREPHKPSSTGRVFVKDAHGNEHEYFPGVIGARFEEEEPSDTDGDTSKWNENGEGQERDNDRYAQRAYRD